MNRPSSGAKAALMPGGLVSFRREYFALRHSFRRFGFVGSGPLEPGEGRRYSAIPPPHLCPTPTSNSDDASRYRVIISLGVFKMMNP